MKETAQKTTKLLTQILMELEETFPLSHWSFRREDSHPIRRELEVGKIKTELRVRALEVGGNTSSLLLEASVRVKSEIHQRLPDSHRILFNYWLSNRFEILKLHYDADTDELELSGTSLFLKGRSESEKSALATWIEGLSHHAEKLIEILAHLNRTEDQDLPALIQDLHTKAIRIEQMLPSRKTTLAKDFCLTDYSIDFMDCIQSFWGENTFKLMETEDPSFRKILSDERVFLMKEFQPGFTTYLTLIGPTLPNAPIPEILQELNSFLPGIRFHADPEGRLWARFTQATLGRDLNEGHSVAILYWLLEAEKLVRDDDDMRAA